MTIVQECGAAPALSPAIYASAHYGKSLFWYSGELLFAFLLTERAGLSGLMAGLVMAVGFVFSAILDVVIGAILNRHVATARLAGRMQMAGSVFAAVALILLFAMPGTRFAGSAVAALGAILMFRLAYSLVDLPQNALLAIGASSDKKRATLASWRLAGSGLASLSIALMASLLIFQRYGPAQLIAVASAIGMVAVLMCVTLQLHISAKFSRSAPAPANPPIRSSPRPAPWLSSQIRLMLGCIFLSSLAAPLFTKLLPYFAAFQMRDPVAGSALIAFVSIGMVAGQFIWVRILPFQDWTSRLLTSGLAVAGSAILFGVSGMWMPATVLATALLFGISAGGLGAALWGSFATVVAETCPGREALAFGAFTASSKLSNAVGTLGLGVLLSDASFRIAGDPRLLLFMMIAPMMAGLAIAAVIWTSAPWNMAHNARSCS